MNTQNSYLGQDDLPIIAPTSDEKTLALLSHVLTFFFGFVAPLVIYLVKKDESPFVAAHAKESLNFQITITIVAILLIITVIGILLLWIIVLIALALVIVATIKASEGKLYRYPATLRLIK